MALPDITLLNAVANANTALEAVIEGDNYRLTIKTFALQSEGIDVVDPTKTPWVLVETKNEKEDLMLSRRAEMENELVIRGYIYTDAKRFQGLSNVTLLEYFISDCKKALDVDPTRGGTCVVRIGREISRFHDLEGYYSAFEMVETYKRKRNI